MVHKFEDGVFSIRMFRRHFIFKCADELFDDHVFVWLRCHTPNCHTPSYADNEFELFALFFLHGQLES